MAHVTRQNITETVIKSFNQATNERFKFLISGLVNHLHQFARESSLTHDEWRAGLEFLTRASQFTHSHRNEFVLASDVLGLSSLVDLLNSSVGATEGSVLGPFHAELSPVAPVGSDLIKDNDGDPVLLRGRVLDLENRPIAGAVLDFWQTAANGLYPAQDPHQRPDNLRCRMLTGADGKYEMRVIRPSAYTVPYDGPVGDLLRAGGRHAWRPAHFHFIVSAPGFHSVVTELFNAEDTYIQEDAAFGVRDSILVKFERNDSPEEAAALRLNSPFYVVDFDFRLRPAL
ncbi:MAG: dioxygenase [Candidatus Acidiferrales bacterium]